MREQVKVVPPATKQLAAPLTRFPAEVQEVSHRLLASALAVENEELDDEGREQMIERTLVSISFAAIPGALESLLSASSATGAELRNGLVRRWVQSDPAAAAAWTASLPEGAARRAGLEQVAIAWANSDLEAAARWVRSLPEDPETANAGVVLSYEAARTDALTALDIAGRFAPSPERDAALVHAVRQWGATDFAAALNWVSGIPASEFQQQLVAAISTAAARDSAEAAAEIAATRLEGSEEQDRAAVSIIEQWAQTSPQAAAAWIEQFPEGALRSTAAENLAAIWSAQDPQTAARWIDALPFGSLRAAAVQGSAEVFPEGLPR